MPSTLLGNPLASGPQIVCSGNPFSGTVKPVGGIQFRLAPNASGNCYIGFSGNITMTSGGFFLSGTLGLADGMILAAGDAYFAPKLVFPISGVFNTYVHADAACSGQARLYWEPAF